MQRACRWACVLAAAGVVLVGFLTDFGDSLRTRQASLLSGGDDAAGETARAGRQSTPLAVEVVPARQTYKGRTFRPPCPEWLVHPDGRCAKHRKGCKDEVAEGTCAGKFSLGPSDVGDFTIEDSRVWCRNGAVANLTGKRLVFCKHGDMSVLHVGCKFGWAVGGIRVSSAMYKVPLDLPCSNPVGDLRPFMYGGKLFVIGQTGTNIGKGKAVGKGRGCLEELYRQVAPYIVDEAARKSFGAGIQNFVVRLRATSSDPKRPGAAQSPRPLPVTYLNFHWTPNGMLKDGKTNFNNNFMPFEYKGNLYMVTKVFPHIIHRTDLSNGFMKFAYWTECEMPRFASGANHMGGSSSPLLTTFRGEPAFLAVAHTAAEGWGTLRKTMFYLFSAQPPFHIQYATQEFDYGMAATEYATSFLLDGNDILLSLGVSDQSWVLIRQSLESVLRHMSPVWKLERRRIPEEWFDKGYDHVHHRFKDASLNGSRI